MNKKIKKPIVLSTIMLMSLVSINSIESINAFSTNDFEKNSLNTVHNFKYSYNLIKSSNYLNQTLWGSNVIEGSITIENNIVTYKATQNPDEAIDPNKWSSGVHFFDNVGNLKKGQLYQWRMDVKGNREFFVNQIGHAQGGFIHDKISLTNEWQTLTHTFIGDPDVEHGLYDVFSIYSQYLRKGDTIQIKNLELREVQSIQ